MCYNMSNIRVLMPILWLQAHLSIHSQIIRKLIILNFHDFPNLTKYHSTSLWLKHKTHSNIKKWGSEARTINKMWGWSFKPSYKKQKRFRERITTCRCPWPIHQIKVVTCARHFYIWCSSAERLPAKWCCGDHMHHKGLHSAKKFVYNGSADDIIFSKAFKKMGQAKVCCKRLQIHFVDSMGKIVSLDKIQMSVTFGNINITWTENITFDIVDMDYSCNTIIGRGTLNTFNSRCTFNIFVHEYARALWNHLSIWQSRGCKENRS